MGYCEIKCPDFFPFIIHNAPTSRPCPPSRTLRPLELGSSDVRFKDASKARTLGSLHELLSVWFTCTEQLALLPKLRFPACMKHTSGYGVLFLPDRLVGLVVKASASRAEDPGFHSGLRRGEFSGSSHTSDFKIGTSVATLSGAWRYRVGDRASWSGVSML